MACARGATSRKWLPASDVPARLEVASLRPRRDHRSRLRCPLCGCDAEFRGVGDPTSNGSLLPPW